MRENAGNCGKLCTYSNKAILEFAVICGKCAENYGKLYARHLLPVHLTPSAEVVSARAGFLADYGTDVNVGAIVGEMRGLRRSRLARCALDTFKEPSSY